MEHLLYLGVALTRTAAAFALTPLLARHVVPNAVRNSIFVGAGLIVLMLQPPELLVKPSALQWLTLFLREAFIGLVIGFFTGTTLWALESAGSVLALKIGGVDVEVANPFAGGETPLLGELFNQIGVYVFVMSGGLSLFVSTLLESYVVWPLSSAAPRFHMIDSLVFENEFGRIMALALGLAAPGLVALTLIDVAMGLINRSAPQLNVFSMSLSIKSWLAVFLILIFLALVVRTLTDEILRQVPTIGRVLHALANP